MGRVAERDMWAKEAQDLNEHLQDLVDEATAELRDKAEKLKGSLEKEQELNLLQRQFITMASHEFRTPLAIIDSAAQKINRRKDRITPDDLQTRTGKIRDAVVRMTSLMESTLSVARLEAGKLDIKVDDCDVRRVVETVCERQQELSMSHKITTDLLDIPDMIQADPNALEQVFTNLLSNAVKYSPDAPNINVKGWCEDNELVIAVKDNGLGIPEDELPKMFTRFFRAKTSNGIVGTGIGLNLVKLFVEAHQGSISVKSNLHEGSTFTVRLPINGPAKQTLESEDVPMQETA